MKKLKIKGHTLEFYNEVIYYYKKKYKLSYLQTSDLIYPEFNEFARIYRKNKRSKKEEDKHKILNHYEASNKKD